MYKRGQYISIMFLLMWKWNQFIITDVLLFHLLWFSVVQLLPYSLVISYRHSQIWNLSFTFPAGRVIISTCCLFQKLFPQSVWYPARDVLCSSVTEASVNSRKKRQPESKSLKPNSVWFSFFNLESFSLCPHWRTSYKGEHNSKQAGVTFMVNIECFEDRKTEKWSEQTTFWFSYFAPLGGGITASKSICCWSLFVCWLKLKHYYYLN